MTMIFSGVLWLLRFAIGACVFSFLNVLICRLPTGESVVYGRSHCPSCNRILTAKELVPCISYLLQRGKCLGCGEKISPRYFWVELAGGLFFVGCGAHFGYGEWGVLSLRGSLGFLYLGILLVIAFIDWDIRTIYDRFHIGIAFLGIAALWLFPEHGLTDRLIGMIIVAAPMLALALLVEGAFGGGDIKLMAVSGFLLGWKAILAAFFIGLFTGGIYCVFMLAGKRLARKDTFAFGPFLALGLGLAFFWGDRFVSWYLSFVWV